MKKNGKKKWQKPRIVKSKIKSLVYTQEIVPCEKVVDPDCIGTGLQT